jgi:hypothetical protein
MHECKFCKFSCKYESEYNRHLNSKRHKEKSESKNLCDGCFKEFSTKFNKNRHEKSCKIMQTNIETQTNTNIGTQINNNITNNYILPENPEAVRIFVVGMIIKELIHKQTTDCFQKILLNDMESNKYNLMDYIEKFDTKLNKAHDDMINEHNTNCKVDVISNKIDENGEKYMERIVCRPLTHPEYQFDCKHAEVGFKLDDDTVSKILTETLLDANDKIVVTHDNDIHGMTDLLFKHEDTLHKDEILLEFLNKSNKKEICNLSNDFKPASIIKTNYPEYYDKIEEKAINIIQAYSKKTKNR